MLRGFSHRLFLSALIALAANGVAALGGHTDVGPLIHRFEDRYRGTRTLQAAFLERYTENGRATRVESGTAFFRRPGKMRFEYESPEANLFLVDGKNAWSYVPADHTVTRVPSKLSTDWRTPLALLAGEMKVSRICAQVEASRSEKPEAPENAVIRCVLKTVGARAEKGAPKGSASSEALGPAVDFELVTATGELVRVLARDPGGIGIEFHFANWRSDPPVADSLFRFVVPAGVAIVNGE